MKNANTHILELISTYTTHEISKDQYSELQEWLNSNPENKQLFLDYLKLYKKSRQIALANSIDTDKAWNNIISQLDNPWVDNKPKVVALLKPWFKYAAAAAILLIATLTTLLIQNSEFRIQNLEPTIVNNQIAPGTNKATLTLEDGKVVTLEKGNIYQTPNATSNGEEIIYKAGERNKKEIAYNTLTIPRGGQYNMVLADGTKVWLNSESQIRYPVAFTDGEARQVELIYGEAYFDVSPSTEHKGSKFKVHHYAQDVEVLGTEFNIKAYKDETNIYTTLVEGKVAVGYNGKEQLLAPNEQSNLDALNNSLHVVVVDVQSQTSWKDGKFIFKKKPLKEIMKVLSRWYDMDVVFEKNELETVIFSGTFNKKYPLEDVLLAIKNTNFINGFEINNKTITIK